MAFCSPCKHTWSSHYRFCPDCGARLILPTDETRLVMSLQDRILGSDNPRDLFTQLTDIMAEQLSARIFTLYLYDKKSGNLVLQAATGIPKEHIGRLSYPIEPIGTPMTQNLTPWLFQQDKVVYFEDVKRIRFDEGSRSFVSDGAVSSAYVGKYVDEYYGSVHQSYKDIPQISFMGAILVIPKTHEKLGVIKAELKCNSDRKGEFEAFTDHELKIFEAIIPTIALGVQSAGRMEEMRLLRAGFKKAISIIKDTYLQSLSIKDRLSYLHSIRVEAYASILGANFFAPDSHEMALLKAGASLHDLGKMHIPKETLQRTDALSPDEKAQLALHPELGVSTYYKNFHDSLDDLSWLFIVLLHHVYPDESRSYPIVLSSQKDRCHNFLAAFGVDPTRNIYNQLAGFRGNIYKHYNENVRHIYSYRDMDDLHHRFDNLMRMVDIVRLCDALDAATFVRPYQFDPKQMSVAIESLLLEGRHNFPAAILNALSNETERLSAISEEMLFS